MCVCVSVCVCVLSVWCPQHSSLWTKGSDHHPYTFLCAYGFVYVYEKKGRMA